MRMIGKLIAMVTVLLSAMTVLGAEAEDPNLRDDLRLAADLYASRSGLTTYKGYADDLSLTLKLKYANWKLVPFVKASMANYRYLNESIPGNTVYDLDERTATGAGLDLFLNKYIRLRYIHSWVNNKTSSKTYDQDEYLVIYNQYVDLTKIEMNNYLESVLIPRYSNTRWNTYLRVQLLKSFYLTREIDSSNVVYPFVQLKVKENDEDYFGKSGNLASVGLGYKFYSRPSAPSSLAFLLEGHSLIYQSRDFNTDWAQILAVLQLTYN